MKNKGDCRIVPATPDLLMRRRNMRRTICGEEEYEEKEWADDHH